MTQTVAQPLSLLHLKFQSPKKIMVEAARDFQFSVKNLNEAA